MTAGQRYGIEVRAAQTIDAAEIVRLIALAGVDAAHIAERVEVVRSDPAATCLVATGYGGLSGIIALGWMPVLQASHSFARITLFVVDPEERRRGIGRLLLKAASQAARSAGCGSIEIDVPLGPAEVDSFCLGTGFSPDGRVYRRTLRKKA